MSNHEESADAESEDEFEVEVDEPSKNKREISKEVDGKLCEESQKTNEIGSEDLETRDDQKKDELMMGNQEEQAKDEDKSKSYIKEEENHDGALLRHKKFLRDINLEAYCLQLQDENNELTLNLYAVTETLEQYRRIEKHFSKCDEEKKDLAAKLDDAVQKSRHDQQEKKDLAAKLDDAVETLRLYQQEKDDLAAKLNDTIETLRQCQREKKDLAVKLDDNVKTLRHYQRLVQDYHFNDRRKWEKEKQNLLSELDAFSSSPLQYAANPSSDQYNSPGSNAAAVQNVSSAANAVNYQSDVDGAHTSPLMFPRGLASADAQYSGDCERIHGAILEAKPFSWEQERNDLIAKLTATSAWYQYYVHAAYDYQLQNHNLLVERNDLSAKLQSANTSAEFYKACLDDSDDEFRKLREENNNLSAKLFTETASAEHYHKLVNEMEEKCRKLKEEKNELVPKLYAAKAASQLYRSYLHDAGSLGV